MKAANDGVTPTDEGRRRYPRTFGYHPDMSAKEDDCADPALPCTCTADCHARCAGECGCQACTVAFHVFYDDLPGLFQPDGSVDEERALRAYRYGEYDT
jgi:hypothetical protein